MGDEENLKSEYAKARPRDDEGHFIHKEEDQASTIQSQEHTNPLTKFLHDETAIHKSKDDELLDIHVGNPLRRITELLEQIKKQKAFSFTLKGSLGIMGVVLVAGTFGILGGSKALCDKGTQTKIGEVRELSYKENSERNFLYYIPFLDKFFPERRINRKILLDSSGKIIHLIGKNDVDFMMSYTPSQKILTGSFDSCSDTLTVDDQNGIQQLFQ